LPELPAIDKLNVRNGYSSGFASIFVLETAAQSGQNGREIFVERGCCAAFA
jgi:hypothetical protein